MNEEVMIAFITGGFGLLTSVMTAYITKKNYKAKENAQRNERMKLVNHPFFLKVDTLIAGVDRTFTLENKGKEVVFKDIIINQLKIYKTHLYELSQRVDDGTINDDEELYEKYITCYTEILNSLHNFYIAQSCYSLEEKEVLTKVMAKYRIWSKESDRYALEYINSTFNSKFYDDYKTKTSVILDLYLAMANDTISDAERTLSFINGDLKGLVFKGVTI